MANYEAYAKGHGDLLADFKKNWQGKISLSQYGQMHYQNYGKKEGRKLPGGSSGGSNKFVVDGVSYPKGTSRKILGRNPNEGYKAKATRQSGTTIAQENVPGGAIGGVQMRMNKRGQRIFTHDGLTYYERNAGSGVFTNNSYEGGTIKISEYTHREQPAPQQTAPTPRAISRPKPKPARKVNTKPVGSGPTSSVKVNTKITATQAALNAAIAAINAMASGYTAAPSSYTTPTTTDPTAATTTTNTSAYPDAPTWVKTFEDYKKWKRQQSAQTGYLSTVNTSSTGLTDDEYDDNVTVTKLS